MKLNEILNEEHLERPKSTWSIKKRRNWVKRAKKRMGMSFVNNKQSKRASDGK